VLGQHTLFLDEPTFGQDRLGADSLLDRLATLADGGRCIVAITHDMRLVAERATRVIAMAEGMVIFDGPPRELFALPDILRRARLRPPPIWLLGERLGLPQPPLSIKDMIGFAAAELVRA
ncbi:MAG TPA: ABC transporter, partial [Chloroflexota bacterium]|jgi:energy-coupling factor transport system ATP-binding protein|nr:ABC transporter [Chloroflexota bacterium]